MPLYICGFVTLGAALQNHLSAGALIMGWGIAELAVMINTVAVYAYCNDCFPKQQVRIRSIVEKASCRPVSFLSFERANGLRGAGGERAV